MQSENTRSPITFFHLYFTRCMHACIKCMHVCIFSKVLYYTPHMLYISLEIKLELYLLRLWLNVMEHSTGLIVHIIYACMHGCIWTFNHFLMVLNIIFSNRPIHIQKIGARNLWFPRCIHTCMHACIHTILFENSLKHTPTIPRHNLKRSYHYFCVVLSGLDGQKGLLLLLLLIYLYQKPMLIFGRCIGWY